MKNLLRLLVLTLAVAVPAFAQDAQQAKTDLYTKFYNEIQAGQQEAAYKTGKEYLSKYSADTDEYTKYIKTAVESYETGQRVGRIVNVLTLASVSDPSKAKYNEAYALGRQILQTEPDNLNVLVTLGYAGYPANAAKNTAFNQEAINYARKAIALIESGRQPEDLYPADNSIGPYYPFTNREEALAYLNYSLGELTLKSNPAEAARYLVKAIELNPATVKVTPITYVRLAEAYRASEYAPKSREFAEKYPAGTVESPESIAAQAELNQIIDRLMDANARVIAYSGTKPEFQKIKEDSMQILTQLYQFRNNSTDASGLQAYIAGIMAKPLPQPGVNSPAPAAATTPAATSPATTATPATTAAPTTPATTAKPAATPPASGATTTRPAATPSPRPATTPTTAPPRNTTPNATTRPATPSARNTTTKPATPKQTGSTRRP